MLWITIGLITIALIVIPSTALFIEEGGCWVTAGGTMDYSGYFSSFGGTIMTMKDGTVHGTWNHVSDYLSPEGEKGIKFTGDMQYIVCKKYPTLPGPGTPKAYPNYANFGGIGKLNGVDGYYFDVRVFDHGEPGNNLDRYSINIYNSVHNLVVHEDGTGYEDCIADADVTTDLSWVEEMGCITGGNIDIMALNMGHP
jgi:hypothetical protein